MSKRFKDVQAVQNLSLSIGDGEFVVLLGPTGAGKTTTLRLIAGLETADTGSIRMGGVDMTKAPPAGRDVAFVFQQYSLYPHLSVFDNLAFPLRSPLRPASEEQVAARVVEVARLLHIDDKLADSATRLSGGQMQRVALGRALVRQPAIFLMDEPLSSLDAKLRGELRLELKHIQQDLGATILYVTHDQIEAMTMANRIGVMDQGRLVQVGTPREIYEDPSSTDVAARLGSPAINLLPCACFEALPAPSRATTVGFRTEHVAIRKAINGGAGARVAWIEHLGDRNHLHLDLRGKDITVLADPASGLDVGDAVEIELRRPLFFDAAGSRIPT
jgi:multiple sugar transport system ATP-binding protein